LETPEKTTPRPAQLPLRILYIVSRPADAGLIDPRLTTKAEIGRGRQSHTQGFNPGS
jgi:hypothetical protein